MLKILSMRSADNLRNQSSKIDVDRLHSHAPSQREMVKLRSGLPDRALFCDIQEMKQRIKENMYKPEYNVADLYHEDGWAQRIARSPRFEQVALIVIAFNAVWIAVDTDYNKSELLYQAYWAFPVVENCFCIFFLMEWLCRYFAFKRKCDILRDAWVMFDGSLVFMMMIETWVLGIILAATGFNIRGRMGDASILRLVRLLRLTRMARMVRLLRAVPELMILIKGMVAATRSVFFTLCLLVTVIYVFAIGFVQLTKNTEFGDTYFKSVSLGMFTLLLRGTYLDEISELMDDMRKESVFLVIAFMAFVLLAAQTVTSMLIGVLCEVVSMVAAAEKEEMMMSFVVSKIGAILQSMDYDHNQLISRNEFIMMMSNAEAARTLQEVGVDAVSLVDFIDIIFSTDDNEEASASLTFEEFMDVILRFRGSNTATVKDVIESQKIVRSGIRNVAHHLKKIEEGLVKSGVIESVGFNRTTFATGSSMASILSKKSSNNSSSDNSFHPKESDAPVCSIQKDSNEFIQSLHVPQTAQSLQTNRNATIASGLTSKFATKTAIQSSAQPVQEEERGIAIPKGLDAASLTDTLSSRMLAVHRSVTEGHASMHRLVAVHLENELRLRTAAEREVARLWDQNQQLRDMLRFVDQDHVDKQVLFHQTSTGNVISSAVCHAASTISSTQASSKETKNVKGNALSNLLTPASCATQPVRASTLPVTTGSAAPLCSRGDEQEVSASFVRSPLVGKRESEDDPSADRWDFTPIAPQHGQSPTSTNQAESGSNHQNIHATAQAPMPNHTLPRPVDQVSPLPPSDPLPVMHLESTHETMHQTAQRPLS